MWASLKLCFLLAARRRRELARHSNARGDRVLPIQSEERPVEVGPAVAEDAPIGAHLADRLEVEAGQDHGLVLPASLGHDLAGRPGDEGASPEVRGAEVPGLAADP